MNRQQRVQIDLMAYDQWVNEFTGTPGFDPEAPTTEQDTRYAEILDGLLAEPPKVRKAEEKVSDLEVIAALKAVAYDQAPPEFWDVIEREVKAGQKLEDATDIYGEILIDVMAYALLPSPGQEPVER